MKILKALILTGILLATSGALALEILIDYPIHEILNADLSPKGSLLATSHKGNFIEIRSINPSYLDGRLYSQEGDEIEELYFIDETKLLAIREKGVELWERKGVKRWNLELRLDRERGTPVAYGKGLIAYMPSYEEVEIYDVREKGKILTVKEKLYDIKALSLSRDGEMLLVVIKSGEVLAYSIKKEGNPLELGKIKDYNEIKDGRALILQDRKVKLVDLGSLSTIHELKVKEKIERATLRDDLLLILSPKGKASLFKLREGNYTLEREIQDLKGLKFKLSSKGILIWNEEGITLNGEPLISIHKALKTKDFALEGEKLAQVGDNFAIVWDLRRFSPELFFKGEAFLEDGKLYLKDKGKYIYYDLKKGESGEIKEEGKDKEIILSEERLLLRSDGLYDSETKEKILDLRDKRLFLFKDMASLVIPQKGEVIIYKLKGRVAKRLKIPYKDAFADEERGLIAFISPDELSFSIFNLKDESERELTEEKLGKIKEVIFFSEAILTLGENGIAIFNERGEKLLFEEMKGIEKLTKVDDERAFISRKDGTLWLYSIKRRRPLIYHNLNGIAKKATLSGNKIVALLETGELYVLSSRNLTPWLCFLPFSSEDWMVISSGNYFNSSLKALSRVLWLDGRNIYPGERGLEKYKNPSGLRRIWNEL
ncbi:MAG: hypothetical protein NZ900_08030 [Synergistetes bacterium]|nr:hypothetical protein [Synergistota bacterium]MDW8192866.1 hypothetical protein [Synergistota bacterium]